MASAPAFCPASGKVFPFPPLFPAIIIKYRLCRMAKERFSKNGHIAFVCEGFLEKKSVIPLVLCPFPLFCAPLLYTIVISLSIYFAWKLFSPPPSLSDKYWSDCPKKLAATKFFSASLFFMPLCPKICPISKKDSRIKMKEAGSSPAPSSKELHPYASSSG